MRGRRGGRRQTAGLVCGLLVVLLLSATGIAQQTEAEKAATREYVVAQGFQKKRLYAVAVTRWKKFLVTHPKSVRLPAVRLYYRHGAAVSLLPDSTPRKLDAATQLEDQRHTVHVVRRSHNPPALHLDDRHTIEYYFVARRDREAVTDGARLDCGEHPFADGTCGARVDTSEVHVDVVAPCVNSCQVSDDLLDSLVGLLAGKVVVGGLGPEDLENYRRVRGRNRARQQLNVELGFR